MTWKFEINKDREIPTHLLTRTGGGGGASYGFPWDDMTPGKGGFDIPREFWVDGPPGLTNEHIDRPKAGKKLSGVKDLEDRVRRAFYIWRDKEKEKRKGLALLIENNYGEDKKYTGMTVFLVTKDGDAEVRTEQEKAEDAGEKPADAEKPAKNTSSRRRAA